MPLVGCGETIQCENNVCPCTEGGIRDAIAKGGGPYTFDCDGPTTVVTGREVVIDSDVILDGEGNLTVDGNQNHRVFSAPGGVTAELRGFGITMGRGVFLTFGGGIRNQGTLTLTNSDVSQNTDGGITNSGTLTLTNSSVSQNTDGGIRNEGTLTLTNSSVSQNTGGGIRNEGTLTLTNSDVSQNTDGGITNSGTLTLTNCTVSENNQHRWGGGGIGNSGTLTLTNSTVSGNTAPSGGGIWNGSLGENTATVTNSTVSGNIADNDGGGILNITGTLTITNSTLSGNEANQARGIANLLEATLTITNTLVDGDCAVDVEATTTSNGYNIESPGDTCGFDLDGTDQVNVSADDLKLGPPQDNGGPTMTHVLGEGSVAIDVIPADVCEVDEDQRGEPRPETDGTMCDVGAFEVQPEP
jgi:hypothetical protein